MKIGGIKISNPISSITKLGGKVTSGLIKSVASGLSGLSFGAISADKFTQALEKAVNTTTKTATKAVSQTAKATGADKVVKATTTAVKDTAKTATKAATTVAKTATKVTQPVVKATTTAVKDTAKATEKAVKQTASVAKDAGKVAEKTVKAVAKPVVQSAKNMGKSIEGTVRNLAKGDVGKALEYATNINTLGTMDFTGNKRGIVNVDVDKYADKAVKAVKNTLGGKTPDMGASGTGSTIVSDTYTKGRTGLLKQLRQAKNTYGGGSYTKVAKNPLGR